MDSAFIGRQATVESPDRAHNLAPAIAPQKID